MIPYGRQDIDAADIAAVVEALQSDWLTTGPAVERFEQAAASRFGAAHAVSVFNGTVALHLACRALGLGPGDSLWTSPNTFVASANCALYCGASVDFVDIDPQTYNMSASTLEKKLSTAGKIPKIVVSVHFAGQPCDMRAIGVLAKKYRFTVIEDASHAVGAQFSRPIVARGAAYGDYDRDGDLDILVTTNAGPAYLYRNDGGNQNNWLTVRTVGTKSNRDGIGAIVRIEAPGGKQWSHVRSGSSYCSQSDLALTFGLGADRTVAAVEIEWPSGAKQRLTNVAANQGLVVEEGKGIVSQWKP